MSAAVMAEPTKKSRTTGKTPEVNANAETDRKSGPPENLGDLTGVKVYEAMRDMIAQVASLTKLNQQDTMMRYWNVIEEDLFHLLTKRRNEIRRPAGGGDPPAGQ